MESTVSLKKKSYLLHICQVALIVATLTDKNISEKKRILVIIKPKFFINWKLLLDLT